MKIMLRFILAAIGILVAFTVGAWLYQKGSQLIFGQAIPHSELKRIVNLSFFLYVFILLPIISTLSLLIDLLATRKFCKKVLILAGSAFVGLLVPLFLTGGRLFLPEGQLLMCLFLPPAFLAGGLYIILFLNVFTRKTGKEI